VVPPLGVLSPLSLSAARTDKSAKHAVRVGYELMVSAWPELPSAMSAERFAGVRDGILQAFAFDTTKRTKQGRNRAAIEHS
jgi:hypothetical protein